MQTTFELRMNRTITRYATVSYHRNGQSVVRKMEIDRDFALLITKLTHECVDFKVEFTEGDGYACN
jgi:hypothetical protein